MTQEQTPSAGGDEPRSFHDVMKDKIVGNFVEQYGVPNPGPDYAAKRGEFAKQDDAEANQSRGIQMPAIESDGEKVIDLRSDELKTAVDTAKLRLGDVEASLATEDRIGDADQIEIPTVDTDDLPRASDAVREVLEQTDAVDPTKDRGERIDELGQRFRDADPQ